MNKMDSDEPLAAACRCGAIDWRPFKGTAKELLRLDGTAKCCARPDYLTFERSDLADYSREFRTRILTKNPELDR